MYVKNVGLKEILKISKNQSAVCNRGGPYTQTPKLTAIL